MEQTRAWMERFGDPFVSLDELMAAGIDWRYPDGGPINRTSPAEWLRQARPTTPRFQGETA
jgi:hypothetical protein